MKVHKLRNELGFNENLQTTINFISTAMQSSMHSRKIFWVVIDITNQSLAGYIELDSQRQIQYKLLKTYQNPNTKAEIQRHLQTIVTELKK